VTYFYADIGETKPLLMGQLVIYGWQRVDAHAELRRLHRCIVVEETISRMQIQWSGCVTPKCGDAFDMIDVRMSEQHAFELELFCLKR
jgi:hypothetical protein